MRGKLESLIKNIVKEKFSTDVEVKLEIPDIVSHGDFALPCFQFARVFKKAPQIISEELKAALEEKNVNYIEAISTAGPYLNFKIKKPDFFKEVYRKISTAGDKYGYSESGKGQTVMVEFSSPNTNKPLHLGHIRNNLLGDSISRLHVACGYKTVKANLLNDRGIHICKAIVAWEKYGKGETPETAGIKGDHFVGNFYVIFEKKFKEEQENFVREKGVNLAEMEERERDKFIEEEFYPNSALLQEAREMLRKWEDGDGHTLETWKKLNHWVVEGFRETYESLGVSFDKYYHESETYKLGKEYVLAGLESGACYQKEDGSVWLKLPKKGFGNDKILLRRDGTSVYMTQDIGTAFLKNKDYHMDKSIYVVGSEQEYHFQVLFKALELLGFEKYQGCFHLSYGMISLPEGRMKSREGTVVDADDLIEEMFEKAREEIISRNRPFSGEELDRISKVVGLGALRYYILQYSAKTDFTFDPKASIDFNGKTGPYIQYTYARISSLLKMLDWGARGCNPLLSDIDFGSLNSAEELYLLRLLEQFPYVVEKSCINCNTSILAEYLYDLASAFNTFYSKSDNKIKEMELEEQKPKLALANASRVVLKNGLDLLGITAPEQM